MHYAEPLLATVVTNPTNRDLKYTWLGTNGTTVKAGTSVIVPFEVFTAANTGQRSQLNTALRTKMVKLEYKSRGIKCSQTEAIVSKTIYDANAPKPAVAKAAPVEPAPAAPEEPPAEKRSQIINTIDEAENPLKTGEDVVQKATGQETVTVQDAMGWKKPDTDDTRDKQEVKDVKMEEALTENMGDPLVKLAKEEAAKEAAAAKKRSAAAKKAAETRKKNAEAKKKKAAAAKKKSGK